MDEIDLNFQNLNRHQVLTKYVECLRQLRELAEQTCNIRALQFDNYILFQYFQQRRSPIESEAGDSDFTVSAATGNYTQQIAFIKTEVLKQIIDRRRKILYWMFYLTLVFLCVTYKNEASTIVVRNIQTVIYPGMKMWRKMTLPVIKRFPGLTELYDESCLMMNPFFQVDDLNCEPCVNVQNVLDLTDVGDNVDQSGNAFSSSVVEDSEIAEDVGAENYGRREQGSGEAATKTTSEFVPFVFRIKQDPIQLDDFYNIYSSNSKIFQRDAYRVQSTNRDITNLEELFNQFNSSTQQNMQQQLYPAITTSIPASSFSTHQRQRHRHRLQIHNMWRCNRMLPARLLRGLFARPERLPSTGVALERYMAIDTAHAPSYALPDTECANVYIQQAVGTRFIILRPTNECRHKCRTLSVRLPQSFVLSYNWWYWKPISAPDPMSDTLSISLIGSYC